MSLLHILLCGYLVVQALPLGGMVLPVVTPAGAVAEQTISLDPGATWLMLLRMLSYAGLFFLVCEASVNRARARTLLVAIFWIITFYAIAGLVSLVQLGDTFLGLLPKSAYLGSATGPFVNRNSYATFLCFGLVIGTASAFGVLMSDQLWRDRFPRIAFTLLALLLICATLFATNSRMGAAAGAIGVAVVLIMGAAKLRLRLLGWAVVISVSVGISGLLIALFGSGVVDRLVTVESSADFRGLVYAQVLDMIRARPWLGFGGGAFETAFPLFHRPPLTSDYTFNEAHSTYLQLWAELGLVFGSIPILSLLIAAIRAFRVYRTSARNWVIGAASVAAILVGAVHSTVDFSLEIQANAYFLLAIVAASIGAGQSQSRSRASSAMASQQHRGWARADAT